MSKFSSRLSKFVEVMEEVLLLEDFSSKVGSLIKKSGKHHIFMNPTTGNEACSISSAFEAMGFYSDGSWAKVRRIARQFPSNFLRTDLPHGSKKGSECLDLHDIEPFLLKLAPIKGLRALVAFKQKHQLQA